MSFMKFVRLVRHGHYLRLRLVNGGIVRGQGMPRTFPVSSIKIDNGELIFGEHAKVKAGATIVVINSEFRIGSGSLIGGNFHAFCSMGIEIGKDCNIARDVIMRDDDGHFISGKSNRRQIKIGNNVWIGARAIILKGAHIDSGSIVGAGAVVTSGHYPPKSLIVGNPATVKKSDVIWSDEKVSDNDGK